MGYDPMRFLVNVDDEFICAICTLVLESPVQTTCEHLFCNKCITDWLAVKGACPVDSRQLTTNDLGDPSRTVRNLLNKLDIKCDFEQLGCQTVIKLEHLAQHVMKCEYNLDGAVVCDRGCNMTMTRREYHNENCTVHLAKEVATMKLETERIRLELREQKSFFERTVDRLSEEIRKLCAENSKVRQKPDIAELCADSTLTKLPKWQVIHNVNIGPTNLLQIDNPSLESFSFVQSAHALTRTKPRFKVQNLFPTCNVSFHIGFTRRGYFREWLDVHKTKIAQTEDINQRIDRVNNFLRVVKLKNGDLVECGIEFPEHFIDDGNHSAYVYLSVNQKLISKESHVIPADGFFPTIMIHDNFSRLKYCDK